MGAVWWEVTKVKMIESIIMIGSLLTALTIIVATAIKVYRFIHKWESWVSQTSEHSLDNYMSIMQIKIMSPYMPLSERIKAGDKYVSLGGNGEVKHKYQQLLEMLPQEEKSK